MDTVFKIAPLKRFAVIVSVFCFTNLFAQESKNGIYAGHWSRKHLSILIHNDTLKYKYWTKKNSIDSATIICKDTCQIRIDNINYSLKFVTEKATSALLLSSQKDTMELIRLKATTSSGKAIREMILSTTYGDNGQPCKFVVYHYDTNQAGVYPFHPDSMTSCINTRDSWFNQTKHGVEYIFYPLSQSEGWVIKEKRRWKKMKLVSTTIYPLGRKELKYFWWSDNY